MRLLPVPVLVLMIFVFGMVASPARALTINTNLTIGSRGADVTALQQFLVREGYLVMPIGVDYGYFGPLTKSAVSLWQASSGISPAVGFFGPISRAAFTTQTAPVATVTAPASVTATPIAFTLVESDTPYALGMMANRLMLFRALPYEVRPGESITLDGSGFSKTLNRVYFNGGNLVTATSGNGSTLEVTVPGSLSEGEYELSVTNVLGSSDPNIKVTVKVTNNPHPGPIIESATKVGDMVTVTGSGFTSSNNLYTT
ncbi:MAG: peptidoglycan-binding protein, partial [Parcubacteria group bacterium]